MAKNMQPVLKRCRTLGIEPSVMGVDKNQTETLTPTEEKCLSTVCSLMKNKR